MKRSLVLLAVLAASTLGLITPVSAAPVTVEGFTYVKTVGSIDEYTLDANGLQVLLLPDHSSPTLTFMVTYRVGSKNEVTGTTGATHLLEHLMFKGSATYNDAKGNSVKQFLERIGGNYNATTWLDRTNYYANIGSEHLDGYMAIEADRMRNLWLHEEDRRPEMTVVRNEFERGENSPFSALIKEVFHSAYVAHPYHHSTIGWRSDIEKVSIEKLREFYDTFYWPDNATATLIGDFDPGAALALVKKYYGVYPHAPKPIPQVYTEEPDQTGPRHVVVKRAGQLGVVAIAHKIPAATHPDFAAIKVLSDILADGKNSRLYKSLTDKNLSTGVQNIAFGNHDPSLHFLFIPLAPGATHEQVEKITVDEIERLKQDGVTDAEVQAAVAKSLANTAFNRDGSFAIAGSLNELIAAGDWTLFYGLDDATRKVTAADVQRVARKYLNIDQSTTGWFIPTSVGGAPATKPAAKPSLMDGPYYYRAPGESDTMQPTPAVEAGGPAAAPASGGSKIAPRAVRTTVAGVDVIAYPTGVKDVVTIHAALPAGDSLAGAGNPAIPTLVGMLLDQGTTTRDKFAIASKLESVGAEISFGVDNEQTEIKAKCLKQDAALVIGLIAEQLRSPAFSAEEFEKAKKHLAGTVKRELEDTSFRATEAFTRAVYPPGHPNYHPAPEEMLAAIASAKLEDVVAFHKKFYGPAHLTFVVVGDLDIPQIQADVAQSFAGWTGGVALPKPAKVTETDAKREQNVFMADKTSVTVIMGQASRLRYSDPDYQALKLGTFILGSGGFTSRLMASVRDKEGLTYGISSRLAHDTFSDGDWKIEATFAPALLEKGIASTKRQLQQWYDTGITPAELERDKTGLVGTFKIGLATTDGMAASLMMAVNRGYDVNWLDEFPVKVNALTSEQVNAAIKKYLKPDDMFIIKAGTVIEAPAKP